MEAKFKVDDVVKFKTEHVTLARVTKVSSLEGGKLKFYMVKYYDPISDKLMKSLLSEKQLKSA